MIEDDSKPISSTVEEWARMVGPTERWAADEINREEPGGELLYRGLEEIAKRDGKPIESYHWWISGFDIGGTPGDSSGSLTLTFTYDEFDPK